jgi:hypothetical protein
MGKKKKTSSFDDILGTTKLTMGVGVATHVASGFNNINPSIPAQKNTQSAIGMMGVIPVASAAKTTLKSLKDWEDLDI